MVIRGFRLVLALTAGSLMPALAQGKGLPTSVPTPASGQRGAPDGLRLPEWFWTLPTREGCIYGIGISELACSHDSRVALADVRAVASAWSAKGSRVEGQFSVTRTQSREGDVQVLSTVSAGALHIRAVDHPSPSRMVDRKEISDRLTMTLVEMDLRIPGGQQAAGPLDQCDFTSSSSQVRSRRQGAPDPQGQHGDLRSGVIGAPISFSSSWEREGESATHSVTRIKDKLIWRQSGARGTFHGSLNAGQADDARFSCPTDGPPAGLARPLTMGTTPPPWINNENVSEGVAGVGVGQIKNGLEAGLAQAYYWAVAEAMRILAGKTSRRVDAILTELDKANGTAGSTRKKADDKVDCQLENVLIRNAWIDPENTNLYVFAYLDRTTFEKCLSRAAKSRIKEDISSGDKP